MLSFKNSLKALTILASFSIGVSGVYAEDIPYVIDGNKDANKKCPLLCGKNNLLSVRDEGSENVKWTQREDGIYVCDCTKDGKPEKSSSEPSTGPVAPVDPEKGEAADPAQESDPSSGVGPVILKKPGAGGSSSGGKKH